MPSSSAAADVVRRRTYIGSASDSNMRRNSSGTVPCGWPKVSRSVPAATGTWVASTRRRASRLSSSTSRSCTGCSSAHRDLVPWRLLRRRWTWRGRGRRTYLSHIRPVVASSTTLACSSRLDGVDPISMDEDCGVFDGSVGDPIDNPNGCVAYRHPALLAGTDLSRTIPTTVSVPRTYQ